MQMSVAQYQIRRMSYSYKETYLMMFQISSDKQIYLNIENLIEYIFTLLKMQQIFFYLALRNEHVMTAARPLRLIGILKGAAQF